MPESLQRNLTQGRSSWLLVLTATAMAACTVSTPAPNLKGQDVHLTVIHTSDVHSRILPYNFAPNKFDRDNGLLPELAPYGGAARMATLIKRETAKASRVIHLDSGDCFQGAPIFNAFAGEAEMRAMSELGLDAAVVGNHEFDRGVDNLAGQIATWGGFPMLAANYRFNDYTTPNTNSLGKVVQPYTILNVDGLKVGVIGMGNLSSLNSLVEGGNSLGITPLDTDQTVDYYSRLLRPMVDLVVVVSHLGLEEDESTVQSRDPTADNPDTDDDEEEQQVRGDVDVVFGGHLHIVLNPPKLVPIIVNKQATDRNTVLVHSGAFAKTFGRLDLVVHVNSDEEYQAEYDKELERAAGDVNRMLMPRRAYVKAFDFKPIPIVAREQVNNDSCTPDERDQNAAGMHCTPGQKMCRATYSDESNTELKACNSSRDCADGDECLSCDYCGVYEDARMSEILEPYIMRMNTGYDLTRTFAVAAVPDRILRNDPAGGDSQLGNFVANAMRLQPDVQADFALTNSLGIRADFDRGPITIEQMYNVFPFDNSITIQYLSGTEIRELFDFIAARSSERGCKTQTQMAGVGFVMDCSDRKAPVILTGSTRSCQTSADCTVTGSVACAPGQDCDNEICGAELGYCVNNGGNSEERSKSSFEMCNLTNPQCPKAKDKNGNELDRPESCVPSELNICGKVLNPLASYRVAVNDYIANGGSGFLVLRRNTAKVNTGISLRDALIDYMQRMDDPLFEGGFKVVETKGLNGETIRTPVGAIRCNDLRWQTESLLTDYRELDPAIAAKYCPGKRNVDECFGNVVCVLPHNQATDGRIQPRVE